MNIFDYESLLFGVAVISDVHLNAKRLEPKQIKKELKEGFFDVLRRVTILNGIVVNGDLFHDNKLYLEDKNARVAFWFFQQLEEIAKERNVWVRIIKGTGSHDFDQLSIFKDYEEEYDFKIYEETTIEMLDGMNMLFIPEEYVRDPDEHYKQFLSVPENTYDMIFMHGLVKEMEFIHQDNTNFSKKAPIFDVDDLCKVCKGPILAGHIHTHTIFRDQFFYVGSFSRFSHGEEEAKGIVMGLMTRDTKDFVVVHHENKLARVYMKLILDFDDMDKLSIEEIIEKVDKFIKKHDVTSLDFRMNYIDTDECHAKVSAVMEFYKGSDIVKIKTKISTLKTAKKELEYKKRREENQYLTDKTTSFYEKISIYIHKRHGKRINPETISKYFKNEKEKMDGVKNV